MLDIVVTDFGITSPIGISVPEFEKRMFAGDSGIIDLRGSLVGNNFPVAFGGVVDDTNIPPATELGLPLGLHTMEAGILSMPFSRFFSDCLSQFRLTLLFRHLRQVYILIL